MGFVLFVWQFCFMMILYYPFPTVLELLWLDAANIIKKSLS